MPSRTSALKGEIVRTLLNIACLLGLLALFLSHWFVALLVLAVVVFTALTSPQGISPSCLVASIVAAGAAVFGIWRLPLISATIAHMLAGIEVVLMIILVVQLINSFPDKFQRYKSWRGSERVRRELLSRVR